MRTAPTRSAALAGWAAAASIRQAAAPPALSAGVSDLRTAAEFDRHVSAPRHESTSACTRPSCRSAAPTARRVGSRPAAQR
eukprot:6004412-Prymnesium_polylepis.1